MFFFASFAIKTVHRHVCINSVIPAQAGIQTRSSQPVFLDSGFRRNDKTPKRVDGLVLKKRI